MDTKQNFQQFLNHTISRQEVCLAMAKDENEIKEFEDILIQNGWQKIGDIFSLIEIVKNPSKTFFPLNDANKKDAYDFLGQYSAGHIEIFNSKEMKSHITTPIYQGASVVFVADKDFVFNMQKSGFDILSKTGMCYQS